MTTPRRTLIECLNQQAWWGSNLPPMPVNKRLPTWLTVQGTVKLMIIVQLDHSWWAAYFCKKRVHHQVDQHILTVSHALMGFPLINDLFLASLSSNGQCAMCSGQKSQLHGAQVGLLLLVVVASTKFHSNDWCLVPLWHLVPSLFTSQCKSPAMYSLKKQWPSTTALASSDCPCH